jgi:hypothetical protein
MKLGMPKFATYMLAIVISFWLIVPSINIKWLSLFLLTNFGLKSTLLNLRVATRACF